MNLGPKINRRLYGATGGSIEPRQMPASCSAVRGQREQDSKRIGSKVIYVTLVIAVLLIIWRFLGSL